MTRPGYVLAKVLSTLGIAPLDKYRTAAAFEAHLLRESESITGELAWDSLEDMEDISAEYWQLRKLTKKRNELQLKITNLTEELEDAQDARANALEEVTEVTKDKIEARDKAASKLNRLNKEREEIQREGRSIKRSHTGLKTKLEFLIEEHGEKDNSDIATTREELKLKHSQFEKIKVRRDTIDEQSTILEKELSKLNFVIEREHSSIRQKAEEQFGTIGRTNKELTDLGNKLGVIDAKRTELCAEVGRFVLKNSKDTTIRQAVRKQRGLLSLIDEVRASSNRLRRLIGS